MKEIQIISYIEINGEDVPFDSLSEESKYEYAKKLQDRMMETAGYKRKTA